MTAQIAEKFKFEGQDYRLLCAGGSADAAQDGLAAAGLDFDLAGAGLAPVPEEEIIRLAVGKTQTFITAVDGDLPRLSCRRWRVEAGRVSREN